MPSCLQGIKIPSYVLDKMTSQHVEDTFAKVKHMGVNPNSLFQKLMAHPAILQRLQEPHIMQARTAPMQPGFKSI